MPTRTAPRSGFPASTLPGLLLATCLLLSACGPTAAERAERIERIRSDAETLTRRQMLMGFESWAYGSPSDQDSLYRAFPELFSPAAIAFVREEEAVEADSTQRRRLIWLRRYLTGELLGRETAALGDRAANVEAAAVVETAGERIPYRQAPGRLANEPDPAIRARVYAAMDPVLDSINTILREALRKRHAAAAALGYGSYESLSDDLRGFPIGAAAAMAESVLQKTEGMYDTLLTEMLQTTLGMKRPAFRRFDTGILQRGTEFDGHFPADGLLPAVRRFCSGLGIDLDSLPNLTFDVASRDGKNPRAVCYAVDVPGDVRMSIKPTGGVGDVGSLLHELGHGLHFALTAERSFEFRNLGDATVTETFAFLCQNVLSNPAYLRVRTAMAPQELRRFVRHMAFGRLYMIRRYAAKVLFERRLHALEPAADSVYAALLGRATGFAPLPSDRKRYLAETDDLFYSAVYLRAWFLEAQLTDQLAQRFGENWFESPACGAFLRGLWRTGMRPTGEELAVRAGAPGIAPDALVSRLQTLLVFSAP